MAGDPFEPELAAAAAATSEAAAMDAVDELLRARSRSHDRRAAALSLSAPARPACRLRGDRRRLAARGPRALRGSARGALARPRRRAPTTSSARRGRATSPLSPSCARRARTAARLAPESAARWFGAALRLLPQTAPGGGPGRATARPCGGLGGGRVISPRAMKRCWRRSRSSRSESSALAYDRRDGVRGRGALQLGRYEQAHTRLVTALRDLPERARSSRSSC